MIFHNNWGYWKQKHSAKLEVSLRNVTIRLEICKPWYQGGWDMPPSLLKQPSSFISKFAQSGVACPFFYAQETWYRLTFRLLHCRRSKRLHHHWFISRQQAENNFMMSRILSLRWDCVHIDFFLLDNKLDRVLHLALCRLAGIVYELIVRKLNSCWHKSRTRLHQN